MNVIHINSKNVIFIFLALLSHIIKEVNMCYGSDLPNNTIKATPTNSTPVVDDNKKEEILGLCPVGVKCMDLGAECLNCTFNFSCIYGDVYTANCTIQEYVNCSGEKIFQKQYMCRYCYLTEHWEHKCHLKNSCSSVASPQQYYKTNCTVNSNVLCLGRRQFTKNIRCNWTVGYKWSTALILSITLGGFGADRFYLGHWQEGIGKLFSFGGLGVWTLIDVILISMRYLGPADGSLYI